MHGFLNIDKPRGPTSHDVVNKLRWTLKQRGFKHLKVGHAGTLDPMATGVLVVCIGSASRLSEYVMGHDKTYRAVVRFGVETDSYDAEGETLATRDAAHLTPDSVRAALPAFTGHLAQIPPMHSAIKQGGKKLYDLARAGQTIERAPRPVHIQNLTLDEWDASTPHQPEATLTVTCGAGTYIRSLAHDLGAVLEVGAHLTALTRTRSGSFDLAQAHPLDAVLAAPDWSHLLVELRAGLSDWPVVSLESAQLDHILHGRAIPAQAPHPTDSLALGLDSAGELRAVLRMTDDGRWQPHKVFPLAE